MTRHARLERHSLADLLADVGPDAPTLCEGWTTRDLAAHLAVRERRPDAAAGIVLPPLRGYGERIRRALTARPYLALVDLVRHPPWWSPVSNPLLDGLVNPMELFIHHEDVRRARPGWRPRELSPGLEATLWSRTRTLAPLVLRRLPAAVVLRAPGYGTYPDTDSIGGDAVRLIGAPGELLLFLSGRQRAARVQVDGPPALAERMRTARLGL